MDGLLYTAFIFTSVIVIILPGPNVLVVVATSISHGTKRGLQTVLGTSSAMSIQLVISAVGTTWLVESLTKGFEWLRWLGVIYLAYLGMLHLSRLLKQRNVNQEVSILNSYSRGFIVSLANPKTILFFSAFMPQFVSKGGDYMTQTLILSATFLFLATVFDSLYAIFSGQLRGLLQAKHTLKVQNSISGLLYISAAAWLACFRRA